MKKALRLTALACVLALLLCACGEAPEASPAPSGEDLGYPQADTVMPGDTVMFRAAGGEVCWQELYYWIVSSLEMTKQETGSLPAWDEKVQDQPFDAFTKLDAAKAALLYRVVEQKAAEMGVALSAEQEEALNHLRENAIESFGSEEAYLAFLEKNYLTEEMYSYFQRVSDLYYGLFTGYFGENGERCTDEDAVEVAEEAGYLRAKHILVKTQEEAKEILAQLDAAGADYMALFDRLMQEKSTDPGLSTYPDGYLFTSGEMVEAFETATRDLDYNQYSGVVESSNGYHIILRLPIDPDQTLEAGYSIRYYAASILFENIVSQWAEEAEAGIEYTEAYESLSLKEIFGE